MEEDMKILEYYNKIKPKESLDEQYKLIICQIYSVMNNFEDGLCEEMQEKVAEVKQFIENLIKGYREKEESEKYLYDAYQDAGKKMFEYAEQLEDSVPKSKIKEKIEEIEKEKEETYTKFLAGNRKDEFLSTKGKMLEGATKALQELMEDK